MAVPQSSRFHQFARRVLSLKERYDADVNESFFPTIEMAGPTMPDMMRLRGEGLWSQSIIQAAGGVGNFNRVHIGVPAGMVSVISGFAWSANSPGSESIRLAFLQEGPVGVPVISLDGRNPIGLASTFFSTDTVVGLPTSQFAAFQEAIANDMKFIFNFPIVFIAGRNIVFVFDTANNATELTVWGYERALEPSETF